jgi:hypothetical protein
MDVEALVARYDEVTQPQEAELLSRLIQEGWEAGCWIRPDPAKILPATQQEVAEFLERMRQRKGFARRAEDDPFPNGRPCEPIEGEEPCYIVLTQRCDIAGLLRNEPLVELAPTTICTSQQRIDNAWRNSPREFPIDPRANPTHLVDLRYRFYIAKLDLVGLPVRQALPGDEPGYQVRERFTLRTGQRYTRSAVPDRLAEKVISPLYELVKDDEELNALFTEWALFHGGQRERKPGIVATYREEIDELQSDNEQAEQADKIRQAAEDKFQEVVDALPDDARAELDLDDDHRTRAVSEREHTVALWRLSWKLEWDAESFDGNVDAATPVR